MTEPQTTTDQPPTQPAELVIDYPPGLGARQRAAHEALVRHGGDRKLAAGELGITRQELSNLVHRTKWLKSRWALPGMIGRQGNSSQARLVSMIKGRVEGGADLENFMTAKIRSEAEIAAFVNREEVLDGNLLVWRMVRDRLANLKEDSEPGYMRMLFEAFESLNAAIQNHYESSLKQYYVLNKIGHMNGQGARGRGKTGGSPGFQPKAQIVAQAGAVVNLGKT